MSGPLALDGWLQAMSPMVDREIARQHLELATRHLAEGRKLVEAQAALVARLERDGHDTRQARMLLAQFEQTLALQLQLRDHAVQELGQE